MSEDASVAVVVALLMVVFLGFAALVIDLGALFETRRDLAGDLDAAALAAVLEAGEHVYTRVPASNRCGPGSPSGSPSTQTGSWDAVRRTLEANASTAAVSASDLTIYCPTTNVLVATVAGAQGSLGTFSGSADTRTATGSTSARYVPGVGGTFVPLSVCANHPAIADWIGRPAEPVGVTGPVREIQLTGDGAPCGDAPGNWGWFGATSGSQLNSWITNGLPDGAEIGFDPPSCDIPGGLASSDGWCRGGPGFRSVLLSALGTHVCTPGSTSGTLDCDAITLVIHGTAADGGATARLQPVGFLDVRLRSVTSTGPDRGTIRMEFRAYRDGVDEVPFTPPSAYLCSVERAPSDHDRCTN